MADTTPESLWSRITDGETVFQWNPLEEEWEPSTNLWIGAVAQTRIMREINEDRTLTEASAIVTLWCHPDGFLAVGVQTIDEAFPALDSAGPK